MAIRVNSESPENLNIVYVTNIVKEPVYLERLVVVTNVIKKTPEKPVVKKRIKGNGIFLFIRFVIIFSPLVFFINDSLC